MLPLHDILVEQFKSEFGEDLLHCEIRNRPEGVKRPRDQRSLWLTFHRRHFHMAVTFLSRFGAPHISCPMASREYEDRIDLIYPFTIYGGTGNYMELPVIITAQVPRDDLRIRTVTDIVPGILFMERETREMLGIDIEDIPDERRLFTPGNLPPEMKPMLETYRGAGRGGGR